MQHEVRRGNCHYCGYLCGFEVSLEDDQVTGMKPDVTRYPYDPSVSARCLRWRMNIDDLDAPDRLNYPLRRVGERGSGQFERVSWDEALDDIAQRLADLRDQYGGHTLASAIAGAHATYWPLHRFMNQFGSPNNMGIGQICWDPRIFMDAITFGWPAESDLSEETRVIILWATNPAESDNSLFWTQIKACHKAGIPLIVVDPRKTTTAREADIHLMPWPGSDAFLALSMLHVIVEEGLYDHEFVEQYCEGFEGLRAHVKTYAPEVTEVYTRVPAEDVRKAARIYASSGPAILLSGRGADQLGPNTEPAVRSFCLLQAITGNVDRPGASILHDRSDFCAEITMERPDLMTEEARSFQLNTSPLQSYGGYQLVNAHTERFGRTLPERYLTSAHPGMVMRAMRDGKPYPVRALIVMGANPVLTYANTTLVKEALESLDLCVVADYRLTPTAQFADYVLPVAGALERDQCQIHGGVANYAYGGTAAIEPLYERRCDFDIFYGLAQRLGMAEAWPHASLHEEFDALFAPTGMSFDQFAEQGIYAPAPAYYKHQLPTAEGRPQGFATPSSKVELASSLIVQLGGHAYPVPVQETLAHADLNQAKLVLLTGARFQPYWASSYFQNQDFRKRRPFPLVSMSAQTAQILGLAEGDWVRISNEHGSACFKLAFEEMPLGVASAQYGWWLPEQPAGAPGFSGALVSNINMLTDNSVEDCETLIGTWTYNGIEAHIEKVSCPEEFASLDTES